MAPRAMRCDVCFLFRGDVRYDTRLRNQVGAFVGSGKSCLVIQGASRRESFASDGARVESFDSRGRGPLGFLEYWMRASTRAAHVTAKTWWAAELYSLPIAVSRARATGGRVAYDAREIFAHLGALRGKPARQFFWSVLERILIRRVDAVVSSGVMDSVHLAGRYGIEPPHVLRNLPRFRTVARNTRLHHALGIAPSTPICLYIGGLQKGRGIDMMLAMAGRMPEAAFVFVGSGPLAAVINDTRRLLTNVHHLGAVRNEEVLDCAASATLGFALIEPITLSYRLALPNKLFEYIMAGTPVVVTELPQMKEIVDRYGVGVAVPEDGEDEALAAARRLLTDGAFYTRCAANCVDAARDLCWEAEQEGFMTFAREKGLL